MTTQQAPRTGTPPKGATIAEDVKIVIVSGQEFRVPIDAKVDELRAHLSGMFPDVAAAKVQEGYKEYQTPGATQSIWYKTLEFVKQVGTKGATTADLLALLDQLPSVRLDAPPGGIGNLLADVLSGQATISEALDRKVLAQILVIPRRDFQNGGLLCSRLDDLSPLAAADDRLVW